jgi:hypothetical protein
MNKTATLTNRLIRPGVQVLKLDKTKAEVKYPWTPKRRTKRADQMNTYTHLQQVGRTSMIQIGEDEFRTPNRQERRSAGIGLRRNQHPMAHLTQSRRPR